MLDWWNGFASIGGWFLFFLLDVGLATWMLFDSPRRKTGATAWLVGIVLASLLILPAAIVHHFNQDASYQTREILSWVAIIFGGALPIAIALGYAIAVVNAPPAPVAAPPPPPPSRPPRRREEANASLVVIAGQERGREYRLLRGDVPIGRRPEGNDIVLRGDRSVSREHALIREEHGHFTLFDRGAKAGTFVNGHRVREPVLLQDGDEIALGDTRLRFVKLT